MRVNESVGFAIALRAILFFFSLSSFLVAVKGGEMPIAVGLYLSAIAPYKNAEYDYACYADVQIELTDDGFKKRSGGILASRGHGQCEFDNSNIRLEYEQFSRENEPSLFRIESFCDGKRYTYFPARKEGGILGKKNIWELSPATALGQHPPIPNSSELSVLNLIERTLYRGNIAETGNGFVIPDLFGRQGAPVSYDLELRLDPRFDNLPSRIITWKMEMGRRSKLFEQVMADFKQVDGLWIPTSLVSIYRENLASVELTEITQADLNTTLTMPYSILYPDDADYYDGVNKVGHGPNYGKIAEPKQESLTAAPVTKRITKPWGNSNAFFWLFAGLTVIFSVFFVAKKVRTRYY